MIILVLSLTPGNKLPEIKFTLFEIDKIVHFLFYFILALLMSFGFYSKKNEPFYKRVVVIIAIGISIGGLVEILQGNFIPNRCFDFFDIFANSSGTIAGYVIFEKYCINKLKTW